MNKKNAEIQIKVGFDQGAPYAGLGNMPEGVFHFGETIHDSIVRLAKDPLFQLEAHKLLEVQWTVQPSLPGLDEKGVRG